MGAKCFEEARAFCQSKKSVDFIKNEVYFLGYVVLAQTVTIEDKRIKAVKNWPEPTLVRDIQVFIGFFLSKFYSRLQQNCYTTYLFIEDN